MAADAHPVRPGGSGSVSDERWQRMWSHREALLKVARRRSMNAEDAEDAVHEAMLRAVANPHVDDERLGAWLTTVTMRLCVDRYRQLNREAEMGNRAALVPLPPAPVEEAVCDRAEATWLARRSRELPARQAEALWLKSDDLDVGQVARTMGMSYEAVESLLARARRTLRNSLTGTLAITMWLGRALRPRASGGGGQTVVAASTVATLAVAGILLPYTYHMHGPRPVEQSPPPGTRQTPPAGSRAGDLGVPPAQRAVPGTGRLPSAASAPRPSTPLSLPALPVLPTPSVLVVPSPALSAVPSLPAEPSAAAPSLPSYPLRASAPTVPLSRALLTPAPTVAR